MSESPGPGRLPARRGERVSFTFAGQTLTAYAGETVAAALWAAGERRVYCNMGVCFDCLVRVEGREVRACTTAVREGMAVELAR